MEGQTEILTNFISWLFQFFTMFKFLVIGFTNNDIGRNNTFKLS